METPADRFNAAVGRQLRAEIAAGGSSISAMARSIGIARSALDNYVSGKRAIPVPIAYEICATLAVDPHVVVMRAEERLAAEEAQPASNITALRSRKSAAPVGQEDRAVAKKKSRDPGGDEGDF